LTFLGCGVNPKQTDSNNVADTINSNKDVVNETDLSDYKILPIDESGSDPTLVTFISSSIRDTQKNKRAGLIGIFLPSYPLTSNNKYNPHTIPPRLNDNVKCGFATLHKWSNSPSDVQSWIHSAFEKRDKINPNNSYPLFSNNRTGNQWQ
jgi:hypothetical protein